MGLLTDIKIDGSIIKDTLAGLGQFAKDLRAAITGKVDPEVQAQIEERLAQLAAQAEASQVEVNKIEAASSSVFVAGWRPFIGWVCGCSLAVYYIPQALIASGIWALQCVMLLYKQPDVQAVAIPGYPLIFDLSEILGLVGSLLGLGWYRSYDKKAATGK